MRAAVVTRFGGPEVFELTELPDPVPGPGQVAIDVTYAVVGLVDIYIRQGLYKDRAGGRGDDGQPGQNRDRPGGSRGGRACKACDRLSPAPQERPSKRLISRMPLAASAKWMVAMPRSSATGRFAAVSSAKTHSRGGTPSSSAAIR
jgi:hypothetical protein